MNHAVVPIERICLRLSDSKTGAKIVPLGDPAIELLRTLPVIAGCPFVFPASRGDGHIVGLPSVCWRVACRDAPYVFSGTRLLRGQFSGLLPAWPCPRCGLGRTAFSSQYCWVGDATICGFVD